MNHEKEEDFPSLCAFCRKTEDECMLHCFNSCGEESPNQPQGWKGSLCRRGLLRIYQILSEDLDHMTANLDIPQGVEFWQRLKKLHSLRFGVSSFAEFVRMCSPKQKAFDETMMIYAHSGLVAEQMGKVSLAFEIYEDIYEALDMAGRTSHLDKASGILSLSKCIARTAKDPTNEKAVRMLRKFLSGIEGLHRGKAKSEFFLKQACVRQRLAFFLADSTKKEEYRPEIIQLLNQSAKAAKLINGVGGFEPEDLGQVGELKAGIERVADMMNYVVKDDHFALSLSHPVNVSRPIRGIVTKAAMLLGTFHTQRHGRRLRKRVPVSNIKSYQDELPHALEGILV